MGTGMLDGVNDFCEYRQCFENINGQTAYYCIAKMDVIPRHTCKICELRWIENFKYARYLEKLESGEIKK